MEVSVWVQTWFLSQAHPATSRPLHLAAANRRLQGARHVALANGIELPFRISCAWLDGRDPIILNDIKANVPVSEAKFGRPAPLKA